MIESTGTVDLVPSSDPEIEVVVDPADPILGDFRGFASCSTNGRFEITSCRVVLRDEADLTGSLMAHELGHCLGLGHSDVASDLMFPAASAGGFSRDERSLLTMMYGHRRPGNAPPDDDQVLGSAGAGVILRIWG